MGTTSLFFAGRVGGISLESWAIQISSPRGPLHHDKRGSARNAEGLFCGGDHDLNLSEFRQLP
jgi:hypothetical protein